MGKRDGVSRAYLPLGILLKSMPIVILPFLPFSEADVPLFAITSEPNFEQRSCSNTYGGAPPKQQPRGKLPTQAHDL
jgi:hypothetical protein